MLNKSKARWFWAWLVEMTLPKSKWNEPTGHGELWRSLVIVRATSAEQAVSKALRLGAQAEGDCRGTLRINGKPALTKFLGVEAMGLIYVLRTFLTSYFWPECGRRDFGQSAGLGSY